MDREKAKKLFELYATEPIKLKNGPVIQFARQSQDAIGELESYKDEDLVKEWKSLVYMNHIYGQVSMNEMQRIALIELEMDCREKINPEDLQAWFDNQNKKAENE